MRDSLELVRNVARIDGALSSSEEYLPVSSLRIMPRHSDDRLREPSPPYSPAPAYSSQRTPVRDTFAPQAPVRTRTRTQVQPRAVVAQQPARVPRMGVRADAIELAPVPPARTRTRTHAQRPTAQPRYSENIDRAERAVTRRQPVRQAPLAPVQVAGESHAGFYTGIAGGALAGLLMPIIAAVVYANKHDGEVSAAQVLGSGEGIGSMLGGAAVGGVLVAAVAGSAMSSTTRAQVAGGALTGLVIGSIVAATNPDSQVAAEIIPLIMGAGAIAGPFLFGCLNEMCCGGYVNDVPAYNPRASSPQPGVTGDYTAGLHGYGPYANYLGPQAPQNNR